MLRGNGTRSYENGETKDRKGADPPSVQQAPTFCRSLVFRIESIEMSMGGGLLLTETKRRALTRLGFTMLGAAVDENHLEIVAGQKSLRSRVTSEESN